MEYLEVVSPIIRETHDRFLETFLNMSLANFYEELNNFCVINDNYDFGDWFSEMSCLSLYLNGLIRNDSENEIAAVQEFCVPKGRCDAQLTVKKNIFLIESKMERYKSPVNDKHFDIDTWIKYDQNVIKKQLNYYYEIEKNYYTGYERYDSIYLMTLGFKMIKEQKENHFKIAQERLDRKHKNINANTWFYSCAFVKDSQDGIEVYGTVERKLTEIEEILKK